MCDTCGCKGAETFDAEREIHQLIIFDGSRADTLVFENPDDIKDYLYEGLYGSENLSDEKWYIDDDGAEELNKQNFDKKTKNMSINEVIEFLYLDDVLYMKTLGDLDKDFRVNGEDGGIEQASFKKLEDGIYRAEEFGAEGKKVEIRRIVGNQDMKIGELDWEQMDEYDDVDYFLKTINDRLETDNMPDGYGIYMMEPKNSMKAEDFEGAGFNGLKLGETVIIHGEKDGKKTKPMAHKIGVEEKDGFVPNRINIPSLMNPPYTVETSSLKEGDFENHAEEFRAEEKPRVKNITNVGEKVIVSIGDDIYEGSMEDVMLNDYTNSRGQKITFDGEMKGSVEYERDKTTTRYDRERIMQDYVVEIDDEDIDDSDYNLQELDIAKEEIKERIKEEVERYPKNYKNGGEIDVQSYTEVEFEDGTKREIYAYGEMKSPQIVDTDEMYGDDVEYSESSGSYFAETLGAESTPFAEGRNAAKTMWMPDSTKEDYYSGVDTEYMITYDITPDELMQEIENNSSRYLQFFSGWDDGWNESSLVGLGVIQDPMQEDFDDDDVMMDYEFAGEYIGDEYVPSDKEVMAYGGVAVLLLSAALGYKMTERLLKKSETFKAPETCTNDDDCPDGKVCVDGQCLPICEDDGDCASWQECRSDLHPTEKVCGEDLTYSTSNPFIPTPKPQENAEQPPEKTESRFSPKNLAVGGGVVAVALVGLTAMRMKGRGDE